MFLFFQKYLGISILDIYKCPFFDFANICWKIEKRETIKKISVSSEKKKFEFCDDKFFLKNILIK